MARSPFRRDALSASRKPASVDQVVIDRFSPLAIGLRALFLFEDRRFTDIVLNRTVTRRGSLATARGVHGGQVHSALTGASGAAATPALVLSPEDAPTSAFSLSGLVRFTGTAPTAGTYNALGGCLVSDDTARMPLYVSVAGGSFRTRVPAETEFLSGGQPLLASSLTGWHRLTVTVLGSTATLYVDGGRTWIGTATQAFANFSPRALFGSDLSAGTEWRWDTVDLFTWSRALSADEVATHARGPYAVLKPRSADRWTAAVLPTSDLPAIGNPWDDVFSNEFGPNPPSTATMQTSGVGSLSASANVVHVFGVSAQFTAGGFLQADAIARRPATASFGATASLTAVAQTAAANAARYDGLGVGSLSANARPIRKATATLDGAGAVTAFVKARYPTRTAQQGVGSLTANATAATYPFSATATIAGAGSLTATTRVKYAVRTAMAGAGAVTANGIGGHVIQPGAKLRMNGNGTLYANPRVRKRRRPRPGMANGVAPDFVTIEVETYIPGNVPVTVTFGHGTRAHGTLSRTPPTQLEKTGLIVASDIGYRTAPGDQNGPIPYPPLLNDAYQVDATLTLEPTRTAAAASWGSILLANPKSTFDTIAAVQNADGRPIRILRGSKSWDSTRGYLTDPSYATLSVLFSGLATPWSLTDDGLQIPLRDASYFLEKPLQGDIYGGSGALDGTSDLSGKPKPKARGGAVWAPIQNVTPTLVDPLNRIYQYNDGPGQVVNLYEGGATGTGAIELAVPGDTTNLYVGTTPIGKYRTDNSRGLFQLGSPPVRPITVDVLGYFSTAGPQISLFDVARYLLTEDMQLPGSMVDIESFTNAAATNFWIGGIYFGSDQLWSCIQAIDSILASIGANLVPTSDGRLRLILLRSIASYETALRTYDETQIIALTRRPLPQSLDPPPYRFRVGYAHNYTVMTSDINTSLTNSTRQQFIASPDRFATWYDPSLLAAYRRPNDYQSMPGPLQMQVDAQRVANELGDLWGIKRRLYDVTLPRREFGAEIGDVMHIRYPIEQLTSGQDGRVVGYTLRATDATVTYQVLV